MQHPVVMVFRKRLKKRGYTDVSIKVYNRNSDIEHYIVTAVEPLSGIKVSKVCGSIFMYHSFR